MRNKSLSAVVIAAVCLVVGAAGAQTPPAAPSKGGECFRMSDWQGWRAAPDSRSIYLRVGINQVWRADLDSECSELNAPDAHLITETFSGSVCDGLDLNLKVGDSTGMVIPCMVSKLTRLTDAEAKALPKDVKP
jgi:hypothetical protein